MTASTRTRSPIRRGGFTLLEALVDEHEKGSEFQLKRSDGVVVQYKIFV